MSGLLPEQALHLADGSPSLPDGTQHCRQTPRHHSLPCTRGQLSETESLHEWHLATAWKHIQLPSYDSAVYDSSTRQAYEMDPATQACSSSFVTSFVTGH